MGQEENLLKFLGAMKRYLVQNAQLFAVTSPPQNERILFVFFSSARKYNSHPRQYPLSSIHNFSRLLFPPQNERMLVVFLELRENIIRIRASIRSCILSSIRSVRDGHLSSRGKLRKENIEDVKSSARAHGPETDLWKITSNRQDNTKTNIPSRTLCQYTEGRFFFFLQHTRLQGFFRPQSGHKWRLLVP